VILIANAISVPPSSAVEGALEKIWLLMDLLDDARPSILAANQLSILLSRQREVK
jgi:hypothetical protein